MENEIKWRRFLLEAALNKGMEVNDYIEEQANESVCDAICTTCGYISEDSIEPDVYSDMCPECEAPTLTSVIGLLI